MNYFVCSMPSEAGPIVRRKGMKRIPEETRYPVYQCEDARLIVTGVGGIRAMTAVVWMLTHFKARKEDFLYSVGICAWCGEPGEYEKARGEIYLARRVFNAPFHRFCYPDLLFSIPFPEADLITLSSVYQKTCGPVRIPCMADGGGGTPERKTGAGTPDEVPLLADMEAAFVLEAASGFIDAHRRIILKIVSDDGDSRHMTPKIVEDLLSRHAESIILLTERLEGESERASQPSDPGIVPALEQIALRLRLTFYQRNELKELAGRYLLRGKSAEELLAQVPEREAVSKKEGRERYEQLRRLLMEP